MMGEIVNICIYGHNCYCVGCPECERLIYQSSEDRSKIIENINNIKGLNSQIYEGEFSVISDRKKLDNK
jgi:hypothetical protein